MTNLDSILKSRDITLPTNVRLVKAMVFPVVMHGCESWCSVMLGFCEESWVPKNWCFWTVVLEKTLESPLDCKEIQPIHPKGDQSWVFIGGSNIEAETPILWPPDASWLIWKDPNAGKDWGREEKGMTDEEMVGWHYQLEGHGFEWTPGVGDGQGGLVCCSSWGRKESDMTERLNWTELNAGSQALKAILGFQSETFWTSSSIVPPGSSPCPDEEPVCPWRPWSPSAHSWRRCPPHHTACAGHWLSGTGFGPPGPSASGSCSSACQPFPHWCWRSLASLPDSQSWNGTHALIHNISGLGVGVWGGGQGTGNQREVRPLSTNGSTEHFPSLERVNTGLSVAIAATLGKSTYSLPGTGLALYRHSLI